MTRTRLEAFSDGVIAIIITIMVLELKAPPDPRADALKPLLSTFLTYVLSFVFVGIYWNNHHHMFHAVDRVSGGILWANLHLLFWLSLVPFVTAWMGEHAAEPAPVATYGIVMLGAAVAYTLLSRVIIAHQGARSRLKAAIGGDRKGQASLLAYLAAIPIALFFQPWMADALYVTIAGLWLVPDRRIEAALKD